MKTFDLTFYGWPFCATLEDLDEARAQQHKNVSLECSCGKRFMASADSAAELLSVETIPCRHREQPKQEPLYLHDETATTDEFIENMGRNGLLKPWP